MLSLKEYQDSSRRLPYFLPWAAIVAPGVVLQKDRLLQKTIAFRGADLASASPYELISSSARLNNALKRLGSGWAFFVEAQRFQSNDYPYSEWDNPAAWLLDMERKDQFEREGSHYESSYFITFVWRMPAEASKKVERIFYDDPVRQSSYLDANKDLAHFVRTVGDIVGIMKNVFDEVGELDDDQTLTYLHSTISTNRHKVKAPPVPMYLDALLPDQAVTPGDVTMLGNHFLQTCSFTGFPSESFPGILDNLNHLNIEYRWVCRFICMDKADAMKELARYRSRWWQKRKGLFTLLKEEATKQEAALVNSDAANKAMDADQAMQELGEDFVSYGHLTHSVTVWDEDFETSRSKIQDVEKVINDFGFTVKPETMNSFDAWLGSIPGHVYANVRRPIINSLNLCHLMPQSAIWSGNFTNAHLQRVTGCASPHVVCSTTGSTPFWLNCNVGDVGHCFIAGPTGSGKSTLLNMLALQWLRYPNARVVFFDKDLSSRGATVALGGDLYEPGNSKNPVGFQPFAQIHDISEKIWASDFVQDILKIQNITITPALIKEINTALDSLSSESDISNRTFSVFSGIVQSVEIRDALQPYTVDGNLGHIFDGDRDDLQFSFWSMIEMSHLMELGDSAILPALAYIFRRVEQGFGGGPTLMPLDEGWLFLSHTVFRDRIRGWLKTLRKNDVYVLFATQELADAAESEILPTLLSQCLVKYYLPDKEAMSPEIHKYYSRFGLSDTEIDLIFKATPKKDYYYRSSSGRRLFSFDMGPVALALASSSSKADRKFLDKLLASDTKPEDYCSRLLEYKGLDWASELLGRAKSFQASGNVLTTLFNKGGQDVS